MLPVRIQDLPSDAAVGFVAAATGPFRNPVDGLQPTSQALLIQVVLQDVLMPNPVPLPPPGFDDLSVDEKLDYLQSLWDRIAASPESIPVPDWHREILDERLKDLEANPDAGDTWEAVQERLRKKIDTRQ
jgi:putative addiction module component (TIGR02574 family)